MDSWINLRVPTGKDKRPYTSWKIPKAHGGVFLAKGLKLWEERMRDTDEYKQRDLKLGRISVVLLRRCCPTSRSKGVETP